MSYLMDVQYGLTKEEEILIIIKEYFNDDNIYKSVNKYDKYDFINKDKNIIYELKSRRNSYNKYPTTLISLDKIDKDYENIFIFNFTDGVYYIKYNEEQFNKYDIKLFKRIDRKQYCNDKEKLYIYIPITDLIKIK